MFVHKLITFTVFFSQYISLSAATVYKFVLILLNNSLYNWVIIYYYVLFFIKIPVFCLFIITTNILISFYITQLQFNILLNMLSFKFFYVKFILELVVGLSTIHPPLFYLSVCMLILYCFTLLKIIKFCNLSIYLTLSGAIITILLGGFWGWLNFSWGYIWVYDYIEYLLSFLILSVIIKIHFKYYKNYLFLYLQSLFLCFIFFLLVRFNFLLTRHASFKKTTIYHRSLWFNLGLIINCKQVWLINVIVKLFSGLKYTSIGLTLSLAYGIYFIITFLRRVVFSFSILVLHTVLFYFTSYFVFHTANYFYTFNLHKQTALSTIQLYVANTKNVNSFYFDYKFKSLKKNLLKQTSDLPTLLTKFFCSTFEVSNFNSAKISLRNYCISKYFIDNQVYFWACCCFLMI